ncbi:MAG: hypothetical protein ACLTSX_09570 [Collinsella sp.]
MRLLLLPKTRRRRAVAASTPPLARRPHPGEGKRRSRPRKPETPSVADQIAEGEVKIQRRRPGDGGGAKSRPAIDGPARSGSDDAEGAPKKRRRRRSRKPKQDGGDARRVRRVARARASFSGRIHIGRRAPLPHLREGLFHVGWKWGGKRVAVPSGR